MSASLAGGCLMALEVVWFRFLLMFVSSTTLTVSLMLAVVLAAIGVGGLLASSWLRRQPDAVAYLPTSALVAACGAVASYAMFQYLTKGSLVTEWSRVLYFALTLTGVTSLMSGVIFTLLGEALRRKVGVEARTAGWLVLANTVGAMCGPLVAAFVMLPVLGMERSFFALAVVYCMVGLLAVRDTFPTRPKSARRAVRGVFGMASVGAVVIVTLFPFGLMGSTYFPRAVQTYSGEDVIATREGPTETIFLLENSFLGEPFYHRLVTNGFSMTATVLHARRYMRYFVYWPMLLHEAPLGRVLVICYGVGLTVGAVRGVKPIPS